MKPMAVLLTAHRPAPIASSVTKRRSGNPRLPVDSPEATRPPGRKRAATTSVVACRATMERPHS